MPVLLMKGRQRPVEGRRGPEAGFVIFRRLLGLCDSNIHQLATIAGLNLPLEEQPHDSLAGLERRC